MASEDIETFEYEVKDGDTLNSVAARFDTTPGEIRRLNRRRLNSGLLYPGIRLNVPRAGDYNSENKDNNMPETKTKTSSASFITKNPKLVAPAPRFVRASARLMTRCEGVATGCLLVTPNSLLFQPSLSDPLVVDRGPEPYCVARPLACLTYLAAYTSPELIATKPEDRPVDCEFEYRISRSRQRGHNEETDSEDKSSSSMPLYLCFGCKKLDNLMKSESNTTSGSSSAAVIDEFWFTARRKEADALLTFCRHCGIGRRKRRRRRLRGMRRQRKSRTSGCNQPSDEAEAGTDEAQTTAAAAASSPTESSTSAEEYDDQDCEDVADDKDYDDDNEDLIAAASSSDCSHPDYYRGLLAAMSATPASSDAAAAALPTRSDLPLPRLISSPSNRGLPNSRRRLLNRRRLRHIVSALPSRAEGLDLRLVHSARRDGFSLKSAYRACRLLTSEGCSGAREPYCLLLIATVETNRLFGAFLSAEPRISERRYYGTGETFVFRWMRPDCDNPHRKASSTTAEEGSGDPGQEDHAKTDDGANDKDSDSNEDFFVECEADKDFYQYSWTGENMFFMRGDLDHFAIGSSGGRCAIWLDADLCRGRSQPCETFNNPVLSGQSSDEDFLVRDLEIWAFVDPVGE